MSATCKCGARWGSLKVAHCGVCHETFSTVANFDRHRRGGQCLAPETLGMILRAGLWRGEPDSRFSSTTTEATKPRPEAADPTPVVSTPENHDRVEGGAA